MSTKTSVGTTGLPTLLSQTGTEYLVVRGGAAGKLIVVQGMNELPFSIARMFVIYETCRDTVRGAHANKRSSFGFLCLAGSCSIRLLGKGREIFREETLSEPNKLFWIGPMIWKEMYNFTSDCVLAVLSDQNYDANEYIYDFEEYDQTLGR